MEYGERLGYLTSKVESVEERIERMETKLDEVLQAHADRITGLEGFKLKVLGAASVLAMVASLLGTKLKHLLGLD